MSLHIMIISKMTLIIRVKICSAECCNLASDAQHHYHEWHFAVGNYNTFYFTFKLEIQMWVWIYQIFERDQIPICHLLNKTNLNTQVCCVSWHRSVKWLANCKLTKCLSTKHAAYFKDCTVFEKVELSAHFLVTLVKCFHSFKFKWRQGGYLISLPRNMRRG